MVNSNAASITQKTTFGWHRIEVVGALSSLVFLGSLSFGTAIEAMQVIISCLIEHSGQETQKITVMCTGVLVYCKPFTIILEMYYF